MWNFMFKNPGLLIVLSHTLLNEISPLPIIIIIIPKVSISNNSSSSNNNLKKKTRNCY